LADEGSADALRWATECAVLQKRLDTIDTLMRDKSTQVNDRVNLYCYQRFCELNGLEPGQEITIKADDYGGFCGVNGTTAGDWLDKLAQPWFTPQDALETVTSWREVGAMARHERQNEPILDAHGQPKINRNTKKPMFRNLGSVLTVQHRPLDIMATVTLQSPLSKEGNRHGGARPKCPKGHELQDAHYCAECGTVYDRKTGALLALAEPVTEKQDARTLHDGAGVTQKGDAHLDNLSTGNFRNRDIRRRGPHDRPHTTANAYEPPGTPHTIDPAKLDEPITGKLLWPTNRVTLRAEQRLNLSFNTPRGPIRNTQQNVTQKQDAFPLQELDYEPDQDGAVAEDTGFNPWDEEYLSPGNIEAMEGAA
jgi:hypothetical protein